MPSIPDPDPSLRETTGNVRSLYEVSDSNLSTMDLTNAIAAEEGSTDTETATTTTEESSIPFEANESTEGYALFANSSSLVTAISSDIFGNKPGYKFVSWGDDLESLEEAESLEDFAGEELNGQQKLDVLHLLVKGTFGGRQSELNEGYGMGWDKDKSPPKPYNNDKVDHVPYLDVFSELPAFDHETLDQGEIDQLQSEGLDMDDFGFDRSVEGPQLPVINGERVPILYEDGDEVGEMLQLLNTIDFEEVTYCPEDGSLQGTPSLSGSEESDSDKVAEVDTEEIDLASNPEAVTDFNVSEIRSAVTDITNLRSIQTMLRAEQEGKNRSSAVSRLEERRNAIQSDDTDAEDSEAAESDDDGEAVDDVEGDEGWSDADKNMISTLLETGRADSIEEAKEKVRSL